MPTDLEKQFFDTFRIDANCKVKVSVYDCPCDCECCEYRYPQITDKQYLELYCALCDAFNLLNINRTPAFAFKVKYFKECVLKDLIGIEEFYKNKHIKHQVQAIFKGKDDTNI